jgi:site-specific DNA recombinase
VTPSGVTDGSSRSNEGTSPAARAVLYLRVSTKEQAQRGGEAEGYSIPAQRQACQRKATDLGAEVIEEYIDAGASARSADRPALQRLLTRLTNAGDVDYVIVHKVDRLARDRADDVAIGLTIHKARAVLVSASEQIDSSPAGTLLHGIMAAIAEFYSKNLAHETKKGLYEKARRGGTPGYAPLGYLNAATRVEGREVKAIDFDPERAPHIQWAFETYAGGEWSITDIVEELARRGMKTRPTPTRAAVALSRSQVHRIFSSPYYIGTVVFGGVEYEGKHPPLVDNETWHRVQDMLSGRRLAGDRSWRHDHYLKGSVFCARCESRLGVTYSTGKTGIVYPYFYCLGRNRKRTGCDLSFLPLEQMEEKVIRHWQEVRLAPDLVAAIRDSVTQDMAERRRDDAKLLSTQGRRLKRLATQREKLIDAYLSDAIPIADLKKRQEVLGVEQREAERLIELASVNHAVVEERLDIALGLLEHCARLYIGEGDATKRAMNQAFFEALYTDREGVVRAVLNPPFAQLTDRTIIWEDEPDDDLPPHDPEPDAPTDDGFSAQRRPSRKPARLMAHKKNSAALRPRSSNLTLMAAGVGFEPTAPFRAQRFSRPHRSAAPAPRLARV